MVRLPADLATDRDLLWHLGRPIPRRVCQRRRKDHQHSADNQKVLSLSATAFLGSRRGAPIIAGPQMCSPNGKP